MLKCFLLYININLILLTIPAHAKGPEDNPDLLQIFDGCMKMFYEVIGPNTAVKAISTEHFDDFLAHDKTSPLANPSVREGIFGGKESAKEKVLLTPRIMIHGNSDASLGHGHKSRKNHSFKGWSNYLEFFMGQGMKYSALYGLSWGRGKPSLAAFEDHAYEYIMAIRQYILDISEYTGHDKVNIIAHSMGNTLTAKAILGGRLYLSDGRQYEIGENISHKIESFVSIGAAWRGLEGCKEYPLIPTCNKFNGFHPDSLLVQEFNELKDKLAQHSLSIWALNDDIVAESNHGHMPSSRMPFQGQELVFSEDIPLGGVILDHMTLKDNTAPIVHHWLNLSDAQKESGRYDMKFYQKHFTQLAKGIDPEKARRASRKKTKKVVRTTSEDTNPENPDLSNRTKSSVLDQLEAFTSWLLGHGGKED